MIRRKVGEICTEIIDDEEEFHKRGDQQWVLMTLGEVYQGLGQSADEKRLERHIQEVADDFGMDSYMGQKKKLGDAIAEFHERVRPEELSAAPGVSRPTGEAEEAAPPRKQKETGAAAPSVTRARLVETGPRATALGGKAITVDADLADKPIKSIEVTCKIEYD